jgi:hypothetical protein
MALLLIARYGFDNVFDIERFMKIVRLDTELLLKPFNVTLTIQFVGKSPQNIHSIEMFPKFIPYKPLKVMYFGSNNTVMNCSFINIHVSDDKLLFVATYPSNMWYKHSLDGKFSIWDDSDPSYNIGLPWNFRFILKQNVYHIYLEK